MGSKIGTGELTPFKDSRTGSETIKNSVIGAYREGFTDYCDFTKATENVTKLTPFKTGPETPGRREPLDVRAGVPPFMEKSDNGIRTFPAFSDRKCESYPKGRKGGID